MTDRLNSEALDFIRETKSAHDPDAADKARVERALATTLGAASLASVTTQAAVLSSAKGAGATMSLLSIAKVLAVVAGVGVVGAVAMTLKPHEVHEVAAPSAAPSVTYPQEAKALKVSNVAHVEAAAPATETTEIEPNSLPAATTRRSRSATIAAPVGNEAIPPSIAQETQLIREAIVALRADHAEEALRLVDRHTREFPSSTLSLERSMLRIDVLCALGLAEEARSQATTLLSRNPSALVQRRIENSCAAQ